MNSETQKCINWSLSKRKIERIIKYYKKSGIFILKMECETIKNNKLGSYKLSKTDYNILKKNNGYILFLLKDNNIYTDSKIIPSHELDYKYKYNWNEIFKPHEIRIGA